MRVRRAAAIMVTLALPGCVTYGDQPVQTGLSASTVAAQNAQATATEGSTPADTGRWQFRRGLDPVSGEYTARAYINEAGATPKPGVIFPEVATILLQCFKGEPVVQFKFKDKVGSNASAAFSYRFDDRPGHQGEARFLQDFRTIVIADKAAVVKFTDELRTAQKLLVRVNSLVVGQKHAVFTVQSAAAAIETAYADCPIGGKKPGRRV